MNPRFLKEINTIGNTIDQIIKRASVEKTNDVLSATEELLRKANRSGYEKYIKDELRYVRNVVESVRDGLEDGVSKVSLRNYNLPILKLVRLKN